MSKKNVKRLVILGIICVLCMAAAAGYSLTFNEGRLVYPMDFGSYQFQIKDVPMILALILALLYVIYLVVSLIISEMVVKRDGRKTGRTRKISPKFGYLGFFGFFYEGKMSNILTDERFRKNRREAELKSLRVGYRLNFILILVIGLTGNQISTGMAAVFLTSGISLICGLVMFLNEYLLYRYDQMDSVDWKDEAE